MKTTSGKVLASVALLGTAAAVAGLGTYGAFTSTTEANQEVTAGSVKIDLGKETANSLDAVVTDMLPGDSVTKFVTLTNNGESTLNEVTLTTSTVNPSALTSNQDTGLKLKIERCGQAWTADVAGILGCAAGAQDLALAEQPIIPTNAASKALTGTLSSLNPDGVDYLKITTSFPGTAIQKHFEGNPTSTVNFSFTATQRTGTAK